MPVAEFMEKVPFLGGMTTENEIGDPAELLTARADVTF
jgi:hypothetical protein